MRVVFYPYPLKNVFYDSIPFRPGTYLLRTPSKSALVPTVSFASYYTEHAAELANQNVFAGFHFHIPGPCCRSANKTPGAPDTPAEIFEALLQRATYVRVPKTRPVPIHRVSAYQKGIIGRYKADNPADSALLANP